MTKVASAIVAVLFTLTVASAIVLNIMVVSKMSVQLFLFCPKHCKF